MSMRVSTSQIYRNGTEGIQNLRSNQYSLQNQISTGRRIVTPQDDPVGSAQALLVSQSNSVNQLYIKNQQTAGTKLNELDSVLGGVTSDLQSIYETAVAAGNGSYSDAERAAQATELKTRLDSLITQANSQDGTGRYIFGGFQSATAPFSLAASSASAGPYYQSSVASPAPALASNPAVTYSGDDGTQVLQVSASQFVTTNATGSEVFMQVRGTNGAVTGRSVFDAVQNMIDNLSTPGASPSNALYQQALGDVSASIDNVSRVRANVGASLNGLDTTGATSQSLTLQYKEQLSNLQDLDYAKALSDVSQMTTQLQAASQVFTATSKLSLFSYI